ncbi:MAG: hypothetical protein CMM94_07710, partial [Rickettsiales bacterium]|nr:hypothetical protein [Rickettsiales bacterium]
NVNLALSSSTNPSDTREETPNQLPDNPFNNTTASLDIDTNFDVSQFSPMVLAQADAAVAGVAPTSQLTGGDDTQDVDIANTAVTSAQPVPEGHSV